MKSRRCRHKLRGFSSDPFPSTMENTMPVRIFEREESKACALRENALGLVSERTSLQDYLMSKI
jgi:hypothetical protein